MKKTVVVIFNDNNSALSTGSHVALRMAEVTKERNVELEVYLFGPAQNAYSDESEDSIKTTFRATIKDLIRSGVRVGTCLNTAEAKGTSESLKKDGIILEFARDAFLRYGAENASVLTF